MKGLILINAYFGGESVMYQPERISEEFAKRGVNTVIRKNDFFAASVKNTDLCLDLDGADFVVYLDKDKYVLQALELAKVPVYNSFAALSACDDKMTTYLALSGHGIPMPDTLPGLLCYSPAEKVSKTTLSKIAETLGFPLIVKQCYGSFGEEVYLAKNEEELAVLAEKVKCTPHLFQKFIDTSYGKDVRVIVVGDRIAGGMLRESDKDFRSNLGAGGKGSVYQVGEELAALALKTAKVLGLDYCGIDFLFGKEGMLVCEVNSNAFFGGFEKVTGVNVAGMFVEHILSDLEKRQNLSK